MARRTDDANKSTDLFGSGKHGFKDYDPGISAGTTWNAADGNHLQEEVCRAIEVAGFTPAGGSAYSQLAGALQFADLQRANTAGLFSTPGTPTLYGIAGGLAVNDAFNSAVAVGTAGTIYRLGSSEQFVADTPGSSYAGDFNAVAAAGATFGHVAVGDTGEIQTGVSGTWTRRNTGGSNLNSVAWDPNADRVVVVGDSGTIYESVAIGTWTDRSAGDALGGGNLYSVAWCEGWGLFVSTGGGIQTSPDGITWTQRLAGPTTRFELAYSPTGNYGIVLDSSGNVHYSIDGLTWASTGMAVHGPSGILACGGGFVGYTHTERVLGGLLADADPSGPTQITCGSRDDGAYNRASYDPIGRGIWLCGPSGAIGFWPAPWGI